MTQQLKIYDSIHLNQDNKHTNHKIVNIYRITATYTNYITVKQNCQNYWEIKY